MPNRTPPPPREDHRTRVLLIDDHAILRQGLAQLIDQEPDLVVCGQAEEAPKGFELAETLKPDVAVVDVSLKGGNGIELIKNLKASHPNLPILVLSMHDENIYAERALRAGGMGYIMKEEAAESVLAGIRKVLRGEIVLSEKMQARMLSQLINGHSKKGASPIDTLSDRELEVFRRIGEGRGTRQIAEELHLSVRTVEAYREYIKEKLGLKNATELTQAAFHWVHEDARH